MKPVKILLVEDNEGDILLTREALEESRIINSVEVVKNGKDALDYLYRRGNYTDKSRPDLILLDINLPLKSGLEVLQVIKADESLKNIPVIMLTTSSSETDISLSYQYHANCFVTKPVEISDFMAAIASIEKFWLSIVSLPEEEKQ